MSASAAATAAANSECLRGRKLWVSDYVSDIASEVADPLSPTLSKPVDIRIDVAVSKGLEFILGHFNNETCWFPRTISTKATEGRQVVAYSKEEALVRFKAANYQD